MGVREQNMITGKTKIIGVIGHPIEHSMSPPMHNNAYKDLKLDYIYVAFLTKEYREINKRGELFAKNKQELFKEIEKL